MDLYAEVAYEASMRLTNRYSTSFSMSSKLFATSIRPHIYAIYGLVRIADEIVDTYRGRDAKDELLGLKSDTYLAIKRGYSVNPIVHAFALTARSYHIGEDLLEPFFESMAMDLVGFPATRSAYETYIYGSAEVVGLMCLKVFVAGSESLYGELAPGARALGAAYQKINFLRDFKADYEQLGRVYFPDIQYETFSESDKRHIEDEIEREFQVADQTITRLPKEARKAVRASFYYYRDLLDQLKRVDSEALKSRRIRVSNARKLVLLLKTVFVG